MTDGRLTVDHIMWLYDHRCVCCRHKGTPRKQCQILQTLRNDPNDARLAGRVTDAGIGRARCPYYEVKA